MLSLLAGVAFTNLKSDLAKVWSWLCHRSFWQLVSMALAAFALVQHFQLLDARHDANSYKSQRDEVQRQLTAITTAKDTQKQTTGENIKVVAERVRHADDVAKTIEQAPLPGNCQTPKEILDADI